VIGGIRDPKTNQALKTRFPRNGRETIFPNRRHLPEANRSQDPGGVKRDGRSQMTALVQALSRLSASTDVETETLKLLAILSGAGLLISILFATYGLDLSPGFF
jgi:hypothetical protein